MIPGSANPLLLAPAGGGYQVQRSLRFNSSDSAYCTRTYSSAPVTRTKGTIAFWVKRAALGSDQWVFDCYDGGSAASSNLKFRSDNAFEFQYGGGAAYSLVTTQVFRDASAWYHFCFVLDSTQATASNRVKMYVNGVQVTTFSTANYPAQNASHLFTINTASNRIGCRQDAGAGTFLSAYLADFHWLDGIAASGADAFTEVSATTGQLIPKTYSGSYGTNGFQLKFADNSSNTAATLGKDTSGNGNNWTPNNLSVTAGAGNDSLVDTPTSYGTDTGVGGSVRGNYATLNPLQSSATLSNGNLDCTTTSVSWQANVGTIFQSSGKWYSEVTVTSIGAGGIHIGIVGPNYSVAAGNYIGNTATSYAYRADGTKYNNGSAAAYGATYTTNDVIGIAMDLDAGSLVFYKNGASQGTAYTSMTGEKAFAVSVGSTTGTHSVVLNAGQRAFAYTAPSGFKALCDTNLPAPLIAKPNTVFDIVTYTGTGATQTLPNANSTPSTPLAFSPDFVWIKSRSTAANHFVFDVVRGIYNRICTSLTFAEASEPNTLTAFNSDGFSLGSDAGVGGVNTSSQTYVGWAWDAGTSTVSNTAGSITSQVRANVSAGFSVVTYTGTNVAATIGHGLGVEPHLIICKSRSGSTGWLVYHKSLGNTNYLILNATDASAASTGAWNNTTPTSTVFTIGTGSFVNTNGATQVSYCFAPVVGYSSMGSYVGNGSSDGPFVYTGFRPRWIMIKNSSGAFDWELVDTSRDPVNGVNNNRLQPNLSAAEAAGYPMFDILSNGFKVRNSASNWNGSTNVIIYAAFAENPLQYARAR